MPAIAPTNGFPVDADTHTEVNAPAIMIPSRPMFTTPERSESTPPSAAKISGVAFTSVSAAMREQREHERVHVDRRDAT